MRLLTFRRPEGGVPTLGVRCGQRVLDVPAAAVIAGVTAAPSSLKGLLAGGPNAMTRMRELVVAAQEHDSDRYDGAWRDEQQLAYLPPIAKLQRSYLVKVIPVEQTAFVKLNSSLVGHRARVNRPQGIVRLDYEPELVFVIGRRALGVRKAEAFKYVAGVTILNDLTDRDAQEREVKSGSRFWTGKNIPGFGPLGPELITLTRRKPVQPLATCA
jgi:5-carboxymethyl-2-hydroxymuconate isomerase/acylpyruvate hydrolase